MKPAKITLRNGQDRAKARLWLDKCPLHYTLLFKPPVRSSLASAYMWALLDDVADQVEWAGKKRTSDEWKALFSASLRALEFVPNLDNDGFVAFGARTSEFSPEEMSDMIELIKAWGASNNVQFTDPDSPCPSRQQHDTAEGTRASPKDSQSAGEADGGARNLSERET